MTTLMQIVEASRDQMFIDRVTAAACVLGVPFNPNLVMYVASQVDLENGPDEVSDQAILALVAPPKTPTAPVVIIDPNAPPIGYQDPSQ